MSYNIPKLAYGDPATEITFDYPPVDDDGEQTETSATKSESLSGVRQVSVNYLEVVRQLRFKFVSESIKASLTTFFQTHGLLGKAFKYFDDKDSGTFTYYELDDLKYQPKKQLSRAANTYWWEVAFKLRRVLGLGLGDNDVLSILNNQSSPVNLTGIIYDKSQYTQAILTCELRRFTDTQTVVARAVLTAIYRNDTDDWTLETELLGDDCGVTFSITSAGQVQYTSTDLSGSNYEGTLKAKQSVYTS